MAFISACACSRAMNSPTLRPNRSQSSSRSGSGSVISRPSTSTTPRTSSPRLIGNTRTLRIPASSTGCTFGWVVSGGISLIHCGSPASQARPGRRSPSAKAVCSSSFCAKRRSRSPEARVEPDVDRPQPLAAGLDQPEDPRGPAQRAADRLEEAGRRLGHRLRHRERLARGALGLEPAREAGARDGEPEAVGEQPEELHLLGRERARLARPGAEGADRPRDARDRPPSGRSATPSASSLSTGSKRVSAGMSSMTTTPSAART